MKKLIEKLEDILRGDPWKVRPALAQLIAEFKKQSKKNATMDV